MSERVRLVACRDCGMRGFHLGDCPQRVGNDAINPKYYRHISGVTTIDVNRRMTFDSGNAFKYVLRHQEKGDPLQDLTKARWYLGDAVKHGDRIFNSLDDRIEAVVLLNKMWDAEQDAAMRCFFMALINMDLVTAGDVVDKMIEFVEL